MNSVEKVKAICKERKIPISRLEKDLGYGNGYIGQLRKGTFPDDRLVEIANYLNVSSAYLTGEEKKENLVTGESNEVLKVIQSDPIKFKIAKWISSLDQDKLRRVEIILDNAFEI